jgi:hypothetical protein
MNIKGLYDHAKATDDLAQISLEIPIATVGALTYFNALTYQH